MLDQPGAPGSVIAGAGFGFSVTAEDAFGNTVPTYATSPALSLPTSDQPAGEALGGTLTPSASNGVFTYSGVTLNKVGSGIAISIASGILAPAVTARITVTPGQASQLVLDQPGFPGSVVAGIGFGFSVAAEDAFGNTVPAYATSPALSLATPNQPAGEALGGTLTPSASNGVFTYSGVTLNKVGSGIAIDITSGTLTPVTTGAITVAPGQASQLVLDQPGAPGSVIAGGGLRLQRHGGRCVRQYGPHLRHEPGAIASDARSTRGRDPRREPGPERK